MNYTNNGNAAGRPATNGGTKTGIVGIPTTIGMTTITTVTESDPSGFQTNGPASQAETKWPLTFSEIQEATLRPTQSAR